MSEEKPVVLRRDAVQDVDSKLDEFHLGVHRMFIEKDKKSRGTLHGMGRFDFGMMSGKQATWSKTWAVLKRLFKEILPIAAGPIVFSVVGHVVSGIMPVAEGVLESRILRVLENAITDRSLDWRAFAFAVIPRLVIQRVNTEVKQWCRNDSNKLHVRVKDYFDGIMFAGRLRMDLPTALQGVRHAAQIAEPTTKTLSDKRAIRNHHIGYRTITSAFSIVSQVVHIVGSVGFVSSVARRGSASYNPGIMFSALSTFLSRREKLRRGNILGAEVCPAQNIISSYAANSEVRTRRNVTFNYPGSQNISTALDDVSFKIGAGDLTVIVGANGSGKSTLVNVLSRLYDTTSGQVLIDGVDIKDYKLSDIRQSIAILTQDHRLFPGLSLRENIGFGDVDCLENDTEVRIAEAVRLGGAERVVGKLEEGVDTVLNSMVTRQVSLLDEDDETNPLVFKLKQLQKASTVSGALLIPSTSL
ncbi:hypothetical protein PQX77_018144 [Marasmius sp. AFHP31]|nr:hypothetical protein PQX77_018144 [Marasmius sp. AFHP31]